jgi:hypothetical protein
MADRSDLIVQPQIRKLIVFKNEILQNRITFNLEETIFIPEIYVI